MLYRAILADPPWSGLPFSRNADDWYWAGHTLTDVELMAGKLPAADDSVLFLWSPVSRIQKALLIMNCWGYQYITNMAWVKVTKDGVPKMGIGQFLRHSHELLLIGRRGKVPPKVRNIRSVLITRQLGEAARKPDDVYEIIENLVDGPRLELFARRRRKGWHVHGNEVESDVIIKEWVK